MVSAHRFSHVVDVMDTCAEFSFMLLSYGDPRWPPQNMI